MSWDNKKFVLEQVQKNGNLLEYASDDLKDDVDVVKEAINSTYHALQFASTRLKNDSTLLKPFLKKKFYIIELVGDLLKDNEDFMAEAIKIKGIAIKFASDRLLQSSSFLKRLLKEVSKEELKVALPFFADNLKDELWLIQEEKYTKQLGNYKSKPFQIRLGNIIISYQNTGAKKEILKFKKALFQTIMKINNSRIPNFSKVLKGLLIVGSEENLNANGAVAFYDSEHNYIGYNIDNTQDNIFTIYMSLIHEFGHKLHYRYIQNGFTNKEIKNLFIEAKYGAICDLNQLPQIGDSLYNLNVDLSGEWVDFVKKGNDDSKWDDKDFVLNEVDLDGSMLYYASPRLKDDDDVVYTAIQENESALQYASKRLIEKFGFKLVEIIEQDSYPVPIYVYQNILGMRKKLDEQQVSKMMRCPSQYSAENEKEFFAEMCTLITLDVVKKTQAPIANRFIEIISRNLK